MLALLRPDISVLSNTVIDCFCTARDHVGEGANRQSDVRIHLSLRLIVMHKKVINSYLTC